MNLAIFKATADNPAFTKSYKLKIEDLPQLRKALEREADTNDAAHMASYLKNLFPFFGIKATPRRAILKGFIEQYGKPDCTDLPGIIRNLWSLPEREFQHIGVDLAEKCAKKFREEDIGLFEMMITEKSWWDTVDMVASKLVGQWLLNYPHRRDEKVREWMESGNMWLQRTCIICQLKYKAKTDEDLLFGCILEVIHSKEFFIRKAIGWALRTYGQTNPEAVVQFVAANENELSGLSKREALRNIKM